MEKKTHHRLFAVLFGILLALVFVRYVLQIPFPWVTLLIVAAVIALMGDRDEIIAMCICCIPLYTSMQYIYALAICMVFYLVKYWDDLRIDAGIIPILMMLVWELLHCFDKYSSVMGAIRALVPLVFCGFVMFCPRDRISYPFVVRTLAVCVSFMCVVVLSKLLLDAGFDIGRAFSNMQRLGTANKEADVVGADFNPNFLGYICILASTGLIQLKMVGRSQKYDIAMVLFLLICGTLTLSRTYLLCLALTLFLFAIASGYSLTRLLKLLGAIAGSAVVILLVMAVVFPDMLAALIARFQVEDLTTGRLDLMALYHERIISNPRLYLFGTGIQSMSDKVIAMFGTRKILGTVVPHNAVQEMIFCWGVPGLILFVVFLCTLVANARRKNPGAKLMNFIPLIVLLVKIQAGHLITMPFNVLAIAMTYLSMCYDFGSPEDAGGNEQTLNIRSES